MTRVTYSCMGVFQCRWDCICPHSWRKPRSRDRSGPGRLDWDQYRGTGFFPTTRQRDVSKQWRKYRHALWRKMWRQYSHFLITGRMLIVTRIYLFFVIMHCNLSKQWWQLSLLLHCIMTYVKSDDNLNISCNNSLWTVLTVMTTYSFLVTIHYDICYLKVMTIYSFLVTIHYDVR